MRSRPITKGGPDEIIVLNAFLRHPLCRKSLATLTTADFARYREERQSCVSSATVKRQLTPLKSAWRIAGQEWGFPVGPNPFGALSCLDNRRERRLRVGEWEKLSLAATKTRNPLVWPVIQFALQTAMRRGEILAMRWDHLDLERRSVTIPESKNGHSRPIPLTTKAIAILERLPRAGTLVFQLRRWR